MLSACCGLVGCWLLGDIARQDIIDVVVRIASLLAYQAIVVLLALWLARRQGTRRDAAILSVITLVLAADFAFFFTQSAMLALPAAGPFTAFGIAQSLCLVGILLRGLQARPTRQAEWLLALDWALIYALPLGVRLLIDHGAHEPLTLLAAFTVVGALMAAHAWPKRWRAELSETNAFAGPPGGLSRGIALAAPVVALTSAIGHVFAVKWVYDIGFIAVFPSPLCLGASAICLRLEQRRTEALRKAFDEDVVSPATPGGAAAGLAILAAHFAWGNPLLVAVSDVEPGSWLGVSPLRLTLLASALILWSLGRIWRVRMALILACAVAGLVTLGHTPETMALHFRDVVRGADGLALRSLPTSRTGWGALLFTMAFLLLGAGAWISVWKTRADREGPE
jgi:hypothetical protein